jgi:hypothetical protein
MTDENASLNAMKRYQKTIREHLGKKAVQNRAYDNVTAATHQVDDFYELVDLTFRMKEGRQETRGEIHQFD